MRKLRAGEILVCKRQHYKKVICKNAEKLDRVDQSKLYVEVTRIVPKDIKSNTLRKRMKRMKSERESGVCVCVCLSE